MNRIRVASLVSLVLISMMLISCTAEPAPAAVEEEAAAAEENVEVSDVASEESSSEESVEAQPEEEEVVAAGVDYAKYAGTELTFIRHSGYDADWMAEKAEQFYQESGIKVNIEQIAYSEMHSKIVVDISSPSGVYDMFATTNYWLPEFKEGDWIIDQQQFLDNPETYNPDYDVAAVSQSMLDANRINGDLLAMPWKFNSQFMFYRTDLISNPPTTWDEMLELAEANNNDSTVGVALGLSKSSVMDVYLNLLYQNGGTLLSEDLANCNLDSQEAKEALEYLVELSQYTSDGAINNHWDETTALFSQGGAAMAWLINTQAGNTIDPEKSLVTENVGFAEFPAKVTSSAASNTWGIAITKNSENPEAASLFIQYLLKEENIKELVEATNGGTIPVRGSLLSDAEFVQNYPWFDVMNSIATEPGHSFVYPMTSQSTAIMEILATHIQNSILGDESVDDALNNAKLEIEALL